MAIGLVLGISTPLRTKPPEILKECLCQKDYRQFIAPCLITAGGSRAPCTQGILQIRIRSMF